MINVLNSLGLFDNIGEIETRVARAVAASGGGRPVAAAAAGGRRARPVVAVGRLHGRGHGLDRRPLADETPLRNL
ncbi:hypothetical protein EVAR_54688_1 [Eumeta japonica]|uniref:Uncharacterized protein n=1 Tax=Eumeta variegata TaxID=151549 RepID=A0A4C1X6V6_EUMVA|nr:hypothetical protein EVAR_54688_1 [Eumeta japonica]